MFDQLVIVQLVVTTARTLPANEQGMVLVVEDDGRLAGVELAELQRGGKIRAAWG